KPPIDGSVPTPVPGLGDTGPIKLSAEKEEDRTTADPLPLGERVHQEKVAGELFANEPSKSQSAADLAAWANDKLAKKPRSDEPPATGLTAGQVRKKLDENKSALQGCIDEALKRDPNLRVGKIHIATTIAPTGQVTTAKIDKRTVNDSPLGSCLKRATMHIAFP